jgi:hypothetical protein
MLLMPEAVAAFVLQRAFEAVYDPTVTRSPNKWARFRTSATLAPRASDTAKCGVRIGSSAS